MGASLQIVANSRVLYKPIMSEHNSINYSGQFSETNMRLWLLSFSSQKETKI